MYRTKRISFLSSFSEIFSLLFFSFVNEKQRKKIHKKNIRSHISWYLSQYIIPNGNAHIANIIYHTRHTNHAHNTSSIISFDIIIIVFVVCRFVNFINRPTIAKYLTWSSTISVHIYTNITGNITAWWISWYRQCRSYSICGTNVYIPSFQSSKW